MHATLKLNEEYYSVTKVARAVNRSRKVITNLLKDPDNREERKTYYNTRSVKFKLDC